MKVKKQNSAYFHLTVNNTRMRLLFKLWITDVFFFITQGNAPSYVYT